VRIQSYLKRTRRSVGVALGLCSVLGTHVARAELTLVEKDGFRVFTEGRINTFASVGFGDEFPLASPNRDGGPPHNLVGETALGAAGQNTDQDDAANKYFAIRGRNGFLGSVLGLGVRRNVTATTTAKGFVALWGHAESFNRDRANLSDIDVREGYVNFEGPWGSLTAGRALGLFGRISTEIDFSYGHNYGLGYPCGDAQGPTCGHIGTGVMFPGFAAGFQYSTPVLAGVQLHVGLYDPVRLLGAWNRSPIARPEGALSFQQKFGSSGLVKLQAEGMFQPISRLQTSAGTPPVQTLFNDKVWGVAGGGRLEAGPLRFGAAAFRGKGLGQYYALQNSPAVFSPVTYEVRNFTGVYAQAALVSGPVQLSVGAGRVSIDQLAADKRDATISNAKSQTGISAAIYYSVSDSLVLGLDYFRFQADWYGAPRSTVDAAGATVILPGYITPERQVVSYLNAGATFHW
jgi:Gram-negative porin